jgi:hypothetical protein
MLGVSRDHISVSPFEGGRRGGEVGQDRDVGATHPVSGVATSLLC